MALSTADKIKAAKFFVKTAFKKPKLPAIVDAVVIFTAVDAVDVWFDAAPDSGDPAPSHAVSLVNAVSTDFTGPATNAQIAILVAGVAMARAGEL